MVTKVEAARIATGFGIPVVLTAADAGRARRWPANRSARSSTRNGNARRPGCSGWPTPPRPGGGCTSTRARSPAVVGRRKSLLPAGITAVDGSFTAGDPVDLVDTAGASVARGLVNYDAVELPGLLGRSTSELAAALGPAYEREVVHRDDLVLL